MDAGTVDKSQGPNINAYLQKIDDVRSARNLNCLILHLFRSQHKMNLK